jgi:hypothetical protein
MSTHRWDRSGLTTVEQDAALHVLELLTHRCPVAVPQQLQRLVELTCDQRDSCSLERILASLKCSGLIVQREMMAQPLLPLHQPLIDWLPGAPMPPVARVAWQLRRRWNQKIFRCDVIHATAAARQMQCGTCFTSLSAPGKLTHDLHLTEVYLTHLARQRDFVWQHEQELTMLGWLQEYARLPDALVDGVAVDVGGKYSAAKLKDLHRCYRHRELPYQLW